MIPIKKTVMHSSPNSMRGNIQIAVYDLSIADLTERKANAQVFPSLKSVAAYFGVSTKTVVNYVDPVKQKRLKREDKYYAIRLFKEK